MAKREIDFIVREIYNGKRVDSVVIHEDSTITRSFFDKYVSSILVNGIKKKKSYKCNINDRIQIIIIEPDTIAVEAENIPLDIIYEDDNYIVINKPTGMVVHPAKGNYSGTLVNALLGNQTTLSTIQDKYRPGIVHRLDKDTAGLIIVAKNNEAHSYLSTLFMAREITKKYYAIVKGKFIPAKLTIKNNIGRDPYNRKRMAVVKKGGKESITEIALVEYINNYSLLDIGLKTGRTHQIRVHLSNYGYPILGDKIYSRKDKIYKDIPLCLVAYNLSFYDKFSKKKLQFVIEMPKHFSTIVVKKS